jgi:hypothetical protein
VSVWHKACAMAAVLRGAQLKWQAAPISTCAF